MRKICNNAHHCLLLLFINITLEKCDKTKRTPHLLYIYAPLTLYSNEKNQS
jgi:hypothetical protein